MFNLSRNMTGDSFYSDWQVDLEFLKKMVSSNPSWSSSCPAELINDEHPSEHSQENVVSSGQ